MKKAKKVKAAPVENGETGGKKKKGGKKKLLLIPIALVLVAAIAAAAVLFVLPKFGINLLGGGDDEGPQLEEPLPKKGVEAYTVGEDTVPSLDTILEEGEGELIALRSPGKPSGDESSDVNSRYTYIYELNGCAAIMDRYLDILMGSEQGFVTIDSENHKVLEEPETDVLAGSVILGKVAAATTEDGGSRILRVVVGWSEYALAVQVAYVDGRILSPVQPEKPADEPEEESQPHAMTEQKEFFENLNPSVLGLEGDDMHDYKVYPQQGWVLVDGISCREMNVYLQDVRTATNVYKGTYYLSSDMTKIFQKTEDGQIVPLTIE